MNKLEKNYLQVPVNFVFMLDRHCFHLMAALLQKYSYQKSKGKLFEDDTFLMSLTELDGVLNNANQKDTRLTIEALYRAELLRVENYNGKRNITKFGINWKMVEDITNMTIQDVKDGDLFIQKLPRTECITYCIQNVYKLYTNCTPNINNIDNINNKNNINNKENINNILKEKENINIINNINIKEKESELEVKVEDMEIKKEIKREIVEEIVSPANNGVNVLSSILVDWTGENVNENNNTTPTTGKSREELERMMEEVIATSTGREEEASNFKMWVKLNKNDLNSAGLMGRAEEVFEILRNTSNKAILEPQTHQVEQESTSRGDALKTPKNSRYEQARKRTPSLPKCEVVDGQEYVCLECGERIPVRSAWEQEDRELEEIFASMEMANAC